MFFDVFGINILLPHGLIRLISVIRVLTSPPHGVFSVFLGCAAKTPSRGLSKLLFQELPSSLEQNLEQ